MSREPKIYKIDLDDLDNLIISIIRRNKGITVAMIHYKIKTDFDEDINPGILLSRIERLISFDLISNSVETIGKYTSRRFFYNKNRCLGDNNTGEHQ